MVSLKHKFVSSVPDDANTDLVQPSDWNDEHDIIVAGSGVVLGVNDATPPGSAVQELPLSIDAFGQDMELSGNKVWHAGNGGHLSGLDADTLDGMHAAEFAEAVHTHTASDITDAGVLSGFRNKIINGGFDIWQRGTSFTAMGFGPDRWAFGATDATGLAFTAERHTYLSGEISGIECGLNVQQTAGNGNFYAFQRIEDVRTLAGKKVTVSFVAYNGGNVPEVDIWLSQGFGSGGSAQVDTAHQQVAIAANHTKYSVTFDVPSIVGKTIGAGSSLSLVIANGVTPNAYPCTLLITKVSIVEGDATAEDDPFSPRHPQQEMALCERYYQIVSASARSHATAADEFFNTTVNWQTMRATPTTSPLAPGAVFNTPAMTLPAHAPNGGRGEIKSLAAGGYYCLAASFVLDAEL